MAGTAVISRSYFALSNPGLVCIVVEFAAAQNTKTVVLTTDVDGGTNAAQGKILGCIEFDSAGALLSASPATFVQSTQTITIVNASTRVLIVFAR